MTMSMIPRLYLTPDPLLIPHLTLRQKKKLSPGARSLRKWLPWPGPPMYLTLITSQSRLRHSGSDTGKYETRRVWFRQTWRWPVVAHRTLSQQIIQKTCLY